MKYFVLISFSILLLFSCSSVKNVPEGKYLLTSARVDDNDTRIASSDLEEYIRQHPNNSLLFGIYNLAGTDTTKWVNRKLRKLGQAPIIYSPIDTKRSMENLKRELFNQGYLNAEVDTALQAKGKKMKVTYNIHGGIPYKVREYKYEISDTTMLRIMNAVVDKYFLRKEIEPGDFYAQELLQLEQERVTTVMRNVGYANFSKENVYFRVDSTLNSHQVDIFMDIYPARDSLGYKRYKINKVTYVSGINADELPDPNSRGGMRFFRNADTVNYKGITIIRGRNHFLRNSTIARNNYLHKGAYYSDYMLTNTYEAFSSMGAISQVSISSTPLPTDTANLMDMTVILNPAKQHGFTANLDATNSAGDFGIAPSVSYQHYNLFNGGETFAIRLKGAYEFIPKDKSDKFLGQNFYEYGGDVSVKFPTFLVPWLKRSLREIPSAETKFSVGLTNQKRPEYLRRFFNFTINYQWNSRRKSMMNSFDFLDVNYVNMPWASDSFKNDYLNNVANPLIKEMYKNQLIARTAYSGSLITRARRADALGTVTSYKYEVEVAGWLPRLVSTIGGLKRTGTDHTRHIMGTSYAEYVKGTFSFAQTFYLSNKQSIAYRVGLGAAQPYGNSTVIPYERRFFGGGPDGVRGWSTRTLGPGNYKPKDGKNDFVTQTGDLSFIFSVENRYKLTGLIELAAFIDAGNIWTIKNYAGQPGGQFKLNSFYKEIALAYGPGLRFDFGFNLLFRLDLGIRLYDPAKEAFVAPAWKRMALHFGIGYPF